MYTTSKRVVLILFLAGLAAHTAAPADTAQDRSRTINLDINGTRGVVSFDHQAHESLMNPDPAARYKAKRGAACSGCHHTVNAIGVVQLWKCAACHRSEGDPKNPKNSEFDEMHTERAFHEMCIGCHRATQRVDASKKAPAACAGCHRPVHSNTGL